jgi:hypothetical protein
MPLPPIEEVEEYHRKSALWVKRSGSEEITCGMQ